MIDGAFHYASLCMAAGYVYNHLDSFGQEKLSALIPHRYVKAKDHGKREGNGTIFSQRLDAGGKEQQAEVTPVVNSGRHELQPHATGC